ncbi:MAG: hypothetical protein D3921_10475 [Candidatus Electrothrix sp. AW1]|nr:hypothetical protein [Candidatus Electrothrix gigas]
MQGFKVIFYGEQKEYRLAYFIVVINREWRRMKRVKFKFLVQVFFLLLLSVCTVQAATRLTTIGRHPFYKPPLTSVDDLRGMMQTQQSAILDGLQKAGVSELYAPLMQQFPQAEIQHVEYPAGVSFHWMLFRSNGVGAVKAAQDLIWAGKTALSAYEFFIDSGNKRYVFAVPFSCGNLALKNILHIVVKTKRVEVPGPERIVPGPERIIEVPGPERIVEIPGPERIVPGPERIVEVPVPGPERIVPGPERIVEVPVPGPERIVPGPERIVEVPVPGPERIVKVPVPGPTVIRKVPVIRRVPGPTVIKRVPVPGPERIVKVPVIRRVPGPTVIKRVPGPERIVKVPVPGPERIVEVKVPVKGPPLCCPSCDSPIRYVFDGGYFFLPEDKSDFAFGRIGLEYAFNQRLSFLGMVGGTTDAENGDDVWLIDLMLQYNMYSWNPVFFGFGLGGWNNDLNFQDSDIDVIAQFGFQIFGHPESFDTSLFVEARSGIDDFDNFGDEGRFGVGLRFRFW